MSNTKHLPIDVAEDILMRLPVKDVLRCKLLSKPYYTLLTSPRFINKHLHSSPAKNNIIGVINNCTGYDFDTHVVSLLPNEPEIYVPPPARLACKFLLVGSGNGLLCAQFWDTEDRRGFLLWNPSTGDNIVLPHPKVLPFDDQQLIAGFGYDPTSDDYKLVYASSDCGLELWTMKTNNWRDIEVDESVLKLILVRENFRLDDGTSIGKNLHWLVQLSSGSSSLCNLILVSFDLVSDIFSKQAIIPDVSVPNNRYFPGGTMIFDLKGSVAVSIYWPDMGHYDIWVGTDDFSWSKQFTIGPFPFKCATRHGFAGISANSKFLVCRPNFERAWSPDLSHCDSEYFWLDPDSKEESEVSSKILRYNVKPWSLTESLSLVSLNRTQQ